MEASQPVTDEDLVLTHVVYQRPGVVGTIYLVFFDDGHCVSYYTATDYYGYFLYPQCSNLERAPEEVNFRVLSEMRRFLMEVLDLKRRGR